LQKNKEIMDIESINRLYRSIWQRLVNPPNHQLIGQDAFEVVRYKKALTGALLGDVSSLVQRISE
jgi:hypothetical protein